jgi:shikimate dehydrogenase
MPRLAVVGQPVAHSRSPAMQNAALGELGLAPRWSYEAIEVGPDGFEALVRELPRDGFVGINVTVPHKLAALALADTVSDAARAIGAANTLTYGDGAISAENTDATGLLAALPESPRGRGALVLGAGGSARACAWGLREAGAAVWIWNRTPARADALAASLGVSVARPNAAGRLLAADGFDLIVNCTTVGLAEATRPPGRARDRPPDDAPDRPPADAAGLRSLPLDVESLSEQNLVVDLVYGPSPTPLATIAREGGARLIDGLEVLVHQGAASLRIWTGLEPPLETMRRAARRGAGQDEGART